MVAAVPDGALILLVGPPAAGKSTYAAALVAAGVVAPGDVLSSDTLRESLEDRQVWVRLRRELLPRMDAGRTTVVDATNLTAHRRGRHIRVAKAYGRPVVAVVFDVAVADLLVRNAARDRTVPPSAVAGMARLAGAVDAETLRAEGVDLVLRP